jgi:hypothetical protein
MHLCFAIPWRTSWKPFAMFFHMIWIHVWLSLFHYSWSFVCVSFHVITWLLSSYCQDYVFYAHVLSTLISALNALLHWSGLWWCMSPKKLFFCFHMIRLKRIYNFWCSMLVLHHFLHVLFTLRGVFMRFLELTNWQEATVPVPMFSAIFMFQKSYIGNILRIGRNKSRNSYFARRKDEHRTGAGGGPEGTLTMGWCAPLARAALWWGGPGPPLTPPFHL